MQTTYYLVAFILYRDYRVDTDVEKAFFFPPVTLSPQELLLNVLEDIIAS